MSIATVKLKDLPIEWKRGAGLRRSDIVDGGSRDCVLYGELFTKHKHIFIAEKELSKTNNAGKVVSKRGDILIPGTSTASKHEMILAREIGKAGVLIGGDINIIRPKGEIFAQKYLPYFFETSNAYGQLEKYITGSTGIIHISNAGIKNLEIPLPALKEQEKVVAKIEELFSDLDESTVTITNELGRLKTLRLSIIEAAYKKSGGVYTKLQDVNDVITDGDHQAPPKAATGTPFIVISNIKNNRIMLARVSRFVPQDYYDNLRAGRKPRVGDILYTVTGSFGIPAIVETEEPFCFQRHIALLRPDKTKISTKYLFYALQSDSVLKQAAHIATGTAQLTVPLKGLRQIEIPMIDLQEQENFVLTLEASLTEVDKLKDTLKRALNDVRSLKQTILTKAFLGELA